MQAASDCELEPLAYELFTQAFVLYEEEVAVIFIFLFLALSCLEESRCDCMLFLVIGLQSSGDCDTLNNWDSTEDKCVWCRE